MSRMNQGPVTTFAEVLSTSGSAYHQSRLVVTDNRLMIYSQGMKIYILDHFRPETFLKLFQVMRQL